MIEVRSATTHDAPAWLRMRQALWPEEGSTGHAGEIAQFFAGSLRMPLEVLLAVDDSGVALGFAELSIRTYAEECVTDRVAYLEGWYVVPEARRQGVGRALVAAAEEWAVAQGCTEFASDALLDNEPSAAAHRALGFVETVRIRCFRKALSMSSPFVLGVDANAVELALHDYLTHPDEGAGELLRFARLHHVLPLWTDGVGCIALQPTGQLLFFAWDDPERVELVGAAGMHDRRMVHAARAEGSRRFPAISGLAPVRDASARVCPSCGGSGKLSAVPDNSVCECGGLGWIPS